MYEMQELLKGDRVSEDKSVLRSKPGAATVILGILATVPTIAAFSSMEYLIPLGTRAVILALAASSLNVLVGYGGIFSLGHAAFMAIGGYIVAIAAQYSTGGSDFWNQALVTWPLAICITAALAFLAGLVSMKREGLTLAMITLAIGQMVYLVLVALKTFGGDDGLTMYPRNAIGPYLPEDDTSIFYISLGVLAIYILAIHLLMRSYAGQIIKAVSVNPKRTDSLGFSVYWVRVGAFVFASVGAALAGILTANANEFVSPSLGNWTVAGELMIVIVLGGLGTKAGPVIGAVFYTALVRVASDYFEQTGLFVGIIVVSVVLFAPNGLLVRHRRQSDDQ